MAALLEQMGQLTESHPYGDLLNCYLLIENGKTEQGLQGYQKLAEDYPQDAKIQLEWAVKYMNMQNWSEGERFARRALALRPELVHAKQMLATCIANQGQISLVLFTK